MTVMFKAPQSAEKKFLELVVTRADAAEVFEATEAALDNVAAVVDRLVIADALICGWTFRMAGLIACFLRYERNASVS
jgi:hypothetical protein